MSEKLYYVQDTRGYYGSSIYWWKKGNDGYTINLSAAQLFTEEEMFIAVKDPKFKAWPAEYIDSQARLTADVDGKAQQTVDMRQVCETDAYHYGTEEKE